VLGGRLGQTLTIGAALARQGHQGSQRRLHRDPALADVLLDRLRQRLDHRQTTRHPARAAVEASGKLFQAQPEAAPQLRQKPALLEGAGALRHLQRARKHQGVRLGQIPAHRSHGVASQLAQRPQALVAIDHDVSLRLAGRARKRHRHDRHLLALLVQTRQEPTLPGARARTQALVAQVELMMLQLQLPGRDFAELCRQDVRLPTPAKR